MARCALGNLCVGERRGRLARPSHFRKMRLRGLDAPAKLCQDFRDAQLGRRRRHLRLHVRGRRRVVNGDTDARCLELAARLRDEFGRPPEADAAPSFSARRFDQQCNNL